MCVLVGTAQCVETECASPNGLPILGKDYYSISQRIEYVAVGDRDLTQLDHSRNKIEIFSLHWQTNTTLIAIAVGEATIIALILVGGVLIAIAGFIFIAPTVRINEGEVGIVFKKFSFNPFKSCRSLIALDGAPGWQADILSPGLHWGYWPWMYSITRVPQVKVPPGKIALVVAEDGSSIPPGRTLGRTVECDSFQDATAFLSGEGEKGRQLAILPAGTYQINTKLFTIVTANEASQHGMNPEEFNVYRVEAGKVGIVTTLEGQPIPNGEIAGSRIPSNHDNFQNGQVFLDGGGCKGLQEEVISPGYWNLNPWFVEVEQVFLTDIPPGTVGVVVSFVGKTVPGSSANTLVDRGYKGIWKTPLNPGQYPINTKAMAVKIVPTHRITMDWTSREKPQSNYDASLSALRLRSRDGFAFGIEVTQVISIDTLEAPKMISEIDSSEALMVEAEGENRYKVTKYSSIRNLVSRVLEPMVSAYFRNSAQNYEALDFLENRVDRQQEAADYIKHELASYGVRAVGTYINEIDLPDELEKVLIERKLSSEMRKNYREDLQTERERRELEKSKTQTEVETQMYRVQAEAEAIRYKGVAEAEVIRAKGIAEVEIDRNRIDAIGLENFIMLQRLKHFSQFRLPNVLMSSSGNAPGLLEPLVATMLDQANPEPPSLPGQATGSQGILPPVAEPRCAIALVLDTSASLSAEYCDRLLQGIRTFQQELADDTTASRCIEIATITLGGTAKVTQPFVKAGEYSPRALELRGQAELGKGIELALKITAHRTNTYQKQNLQYYQPWILAIAASPAIGDWQNASQQVSQALSAEKLNCIAIGTPGADMNILQQITPSAFSLQNLKFDPVFYWLASLMKKISRKDVLERLAGVVETVKSSLPPEEAAILEQCADRLIAEASKPAASRKDYSPKAAELLKTARELGEDGNSIAKTVTEVTKTLGLNNR